jgi:hypothetical protein
LFVGELSVETMLDTNNERKVGDSDDDAVIFDCDSCLFVLYGGLVQEESAVAEAATTKTAAAKAIIV